MRSCTAALAFALALVVWHAHPAAQTSLADPCDSRTPERIVAIGDVHGAYDRFVAILRAASVLDARDRWIGGRTVLVQTGDVLDRGPDSRRVLDLLRRLERDASRAGGRVHALLGNHEVMRMIGDWRYVSAGEFAAFRTSGSADIRERAYAIVREGAVTRARAEQRPHDEAAFRTQFLSDIPLGFIEMRQAFGPAGEYGRWLRDRPAAARVNGILFVHGGITAETAAMGCAGINAAVRRDIRTEDVTLEAALTMFPSSETGPLWDRTLAETPESELAPAVAAILQTLDARAIVIGHTVATGFLITSRAGGRVIQIDTGMLGATSYPGGVPSALEMRGDAMTAIYLDRREPLPRR